MGEQLDKALKLYADAAVSLAQAEESVSQALRLRGIASVAHLKAQGLVDQAKCDEARNVPVDRSKVELTTGQPVPEDNSHLEKRADGQQKQYVVLAPEERAKGFVRPYRDAYRHDKCGKVTTMGRALSETYARDPQFYKGTFCSQCGAHFPVGPTGQFVWLESNGDEIHRVGS